MQAPPFPRWDLNKITSQGPSGRPQTTLPRTAATVHNPPDKSTLHTVDQSQLHKTDSGLLLWKKLDGGGCGEHAILGQQSGEVEDSSLG